MQVEKPLGKKPEIPFNVQDWLKDGWRPVTRQELWEFISRMEVGRRVRSSWRSRLRRFWRRTVATVYGREIDPEDPWYR